MQTTGRNFPLILIALGVLAAAIAPLAACILWFFVISGAQSTNLLNHLVAKAGFDQSPRSEIEFIGMDGAMPEMSRQLLGISGRANAAIPALKRVCGDIGLDAPDAGQSGTEPSMICSGTFEGSRVTVHAALRCEATCNIAIETRVF